MTSIALCILCYNYGRYLGTAIESCLKQQAPDCKITVWVFDDGSTDETPQVCARYSSQIKVSRTRNLGFGATLGRAVSEPDADYICFLDADDFFSPMKIATILAEMEHGRDYILHALSYVDRNGSPSGGGSRGSTSSMCVKRSSALSLMPVKNEISFVLLEKAGDAIILSSPLTFYRLHGQSMQGNRVAGAWQHELNQVYKEEIVKVEKLAENPPSWVINYRGLRSFQKELLCLALFAEMEKNLEIGNRRKAIVSCGLLMLARLRLLHCNPVSFSKILVRVAFGLPESALRREKPLFSRESGVAK